MGRRAWGVVVLGVVIIAAVLGPAALGLGPRVAGTATRIPVAPPPVLGDCLLAVPAAAASPLTSAGIAVGVADSGACPAAGDALQAFGEIVSVTQDVRDFPTTGTGSSAPDPQACRQPVREYLGWTADPWDPVLLDTITLVGPDPDQYADGQRWIACAVATGPHGYQGSVRDGYGRAADLYGHCEDTRQGSHPRVPCYEPHTAEIVGSAVVGAEEQAGLADSCLALASARTGMGDPTAGGQLAVRAGPFDPNTVPADVSAGGQSMSCRIQVVGDGLLVASVVGIGDRPLPWS